MTENSEEIVDVLEPGRLVERDADRSVPVVTKIDFQFNSAPQNFLCRRLRRHHLNRIEEAIVNDRMTEFTDSVREGRASPGPPSNSLKVPGPPPPKLPNWPDAKLPSAK